MTLPPDLPRYLRALEARVRDLERAADRPPFLAGDGSPEGVVPGPVGAVYRNTSGLPGSTFYVKETDVSLIGTSTLGWAAK